MIQLIKVTFNGVLMFIMPSTKKKRYLVISVITNTTWFLSVSIFYFIKALYPGPYLIGVVTGMVLIIQVIMLILACVNIHGATSRWYLIITIINSALSICGAIMFLLVWFIVVFSDKLGNNIFG